MSFTVQRHCFEMKVQVTSTLSAPFIMGKASAVGGINSLGLYCESGHRIHIILQGNIGKGWRWLQTPTRGGIMMHSSFAMHTEFR